MPVFSENEIAEPDFIESAWSRLMHGVLSSNDDLLLPETLPLEERIVLLEKIRQHILSRDENPAVLEPFSDFRELAYERRPDPTPSQWLWLYTQIGERHRLLPLDQILGIMACRDALLPFLESVPDKKIWEWFAPVGDVPDEPLPYPGIEDAIQSDAPMKLRLYTVMCKGVTGEQIFARAMLLEKTEIVAECIKGISPDQRVGTLIGAHTNWKDPLPLFQIVLPPFADEIAAWRDPWDNGFFWYLLRRPVISRAVVKSLPTTIIDTFNTKNIYGISPEDLWIYYRPKNN